MRVKPMHVVTVVLVPAFRFRRPADLPPVDGNGPAESPTPTLPKDTKGPAGPADPADVVACLDPDACFVLVLLTDPRSPTRTDVFTLEASDVAAYMASRGIPSNVAIRIASGPVNVVLATAVDDGLLSAIQASGRLAARCAGVNAWVMETAVSELLSMPDVKPLLTDALRVAVDVHCDDLDTAVRALTGSATVLTVDTITTHDAHRCVVEDIYVLDDMRLVRTRRSGSSHPRRTGLIIDTRAEAVDLGRVTEVRYLPEATELVTSLLRETPVKFEGAVTGYRYEPTAIKVPEYVAASVLVTLADAGKRVTVHYG